MTTSLDDDIRDALGGDGVLTQEQLRRLISWEAAQLGLTLDEATAAAVAGTLARTAPGCDVDLLLRMLDGEEPHP